MNTLQALLSGTINQDTQTDVITTQIFFLKQNNAKARVQSPLERRTAGHPKSISKLGLKTIPELFRLTPR
jgi:hypothetical protein